MKATTKAFNPGFSLIELVIVVAILGVITAIAVPRFADASTGRALQASKNTILSDIENAKLHARASSTQHVIMFDITNERYVIAKGNEITRDSIVLARDLSQHPFNTLIDRTNLSGDNTAIITPFGDLSPPVRIEISAGSISMTIDAEGIPDTGKTAVVSVSTADLDAIKLLGGVFDALK